MITAAVIGCGPHGRRVIDVLARLDGVQLVALVDTRDEALQAAKAAAKAAALLTDVAQLWPLSPQLVCITTNGPSHAELALAAMAAGARRIMVEKPLACSLDECDRMTREATRLGVRLAVDQLRRHDPIYRWLRERIRSGDWGQPRLIHVQRPGIGLGCNGTHSFDLVRFLTDLEPTRVTGWVDEPVGKNPRGAQFVDPGGLVVMELGANVRAVVSQPEDGAGPTSLELHLTAARVRVDERTGAVEVVERDLSVKPSPTQGAVYKDVSPPAEVRAAPRDMPALIRGVLTELLADGAMDCDASHGSAAVEVLIAAYLSHRHGHQPVTLPLAAADARALWLPVT